MVFKLFPKVRRLPTILGILILVAGIAVTTYLTQHAQRFFLKAEPTVLPQEVNVTNLTSEAFSVSWITPSSPSSGYLKYGKSASLDKISLDERDQKIDALGQYAVHHVTVTGLTPQTTYYFKIVSQGKEYGENDASYRVTTISANYSFPSLSPTYGVILEENNQPVKEGVIYVKVGNSSPVSSLVKPSGNWLVSLASLVKQDLKGPLAIGPDDFEEIFIRGKEKTSKVFTTLENNAPVPAIILGKDYDFRVASSPAQISPEVASPSGTPNFTLSQPATGAAIPGQPFFRGTGIPGETVKIKVESETSLNGEVKVDQNGNWTWQVPTDLPPGEHQAIVASIDSQGTSQTIVRKFIVLASGVQVVEAATPSATPTLKPISSPTPTPTSVLKPTVSPKPTVTPTLIATPTSTSSPTPRPSPVLSPTPQATGAAIPESGDLLLTLVLGAGGIIFITLGFLSLKPKTAVRL